MNDKPNAAPQEQRDRPVTGLSSPTEPASRCVELAQRLRDSMDDWAEEYPPLRVSDLRDFVRQAADALASTPKGTNK